MATALLHLAYALAACAWLFKDMLLLRAVAVSSSTAMIAAVILGDHHAGVLIWQGLFIVLNGVQLVILVRERRGITLDEADEELWQTVFLGLSRIEFLKLRRLAGYRRVAAGEQLLAQGAANDELLLLLNGQVEMQRGGSSVEVLRDGAFVGAAGFFSSATASHGAWAIQPSRLLVWQRAELMRMLARNPTLRLAVQGLLAGQLADDFSAVSSLAGKAMSPFAAARAGSLAGEALFEGKVQSPYYAKPQGPDQDSGGAAQR